MITDIPSTASRNRPYTRDTVACRRRNIIERLLGWLKNWKPVATRYDRLARNFFPEGVLGATISSWFKRTLHPGSSQF